jgi:Xaa-Pro aminopeptidase
MRPSENRRKNLRAQFDSLGVDAMLVSNDKNVRYLTGFTGDSSMLLLDASGDLMLSDSRFTTHLAQDCPDVPTAIRDARHKLDEFLSETLTGRPIRRLGIEADVMTVAQHEQFQKALGDKLELVSTQGVVLRQRAIKDTEEIELTRRAARLAEEAFLQITASLRPDQTEREVAFLIEHTIRQMGGSGCSFEPIVGVGSNAALPHAIPTDRRLDADPVLLIDWGADLEGYKSDITRTIFTGPVSDEVRTIYRVTLEAQLKAIEAIGPGKSTIEIDAIARDHIRDAGFGDYFGHGLGHGIGLNIHEEPRFSPRTDTTLEPGMIVTVEPGIYLPGKAGVRLEDDILVTETGHEVLTNLPKDLDQPVWSWA